MPGWSIERRLSHKRSFSDERGGRQGKPARKAANPPRGASVRKGHNNRAPTRRNAPRRNGGGYAVRWLGWGCRYSGQTPPPAADVAKSHRWSDSPNPTSKQVERLILDGTNP